MYKLHKISQRFLCRIPIYSKQGAPGPPARLCAMIHVYPYPGTPTPIPMVPMPTTYIHTCIDTFVLFIYLFYCLCLLFILLSLSLLLFSSLLLSLLSLSPCHWQGLPLGRGSRSYLSCEHQCFILFNYYPAVYMYGMVCMYLHVLYSVCVCIIYCTCIQQMYDVHNVMCTVLCACGPVYV